MAQKLGGLHGCAELRLYLFLTQASRGIPHGVVCLIMKAFGVGILGRHAERSVASARTTRYVASPLTVDRAALLFFFSSFSRFFRLVRIFSSFLYLFPSSTFLQRVPPVCFPFATPIHLVTTAVFLEHRLMCNKQSSNRVYPLTRENMHILCCRNVINHGSLMPICFFSDLSKCVSVSAASFLLDAHFSAI